MRIPLIAANWKMHKTMRESLAFVDQFASLIHTGNIESVICPASPYISVLHERCRSYGLRLGAQNMYWENSGAYTGEISPLMLKDLEVDYVIIGHSERRQLFAETDKHVALKINAAYRHDISPILCVGETLQQRQAAQTIGVITEQVTVALAGLEPSQVRRLVIAYEPVWAIGSGLAATGRDANIVGEHIRTLIGEMFSLEVARDTRVLYGGSVKSDNINEFMQETEIDGALVGGASLDPVSFAALVNTAQEVVA